MYFWRRYLSSLIYVKHIKTQTIKQIVNIFLFSWSHYSCKIILNINFLYFLFIGLKCKPCSLTPITFINEGEYQRTVFIDISKSTVEVYCSLCLIFKVFVLLISSVFYCFVEGAINILIFTIQVSSTSKNYNSMKCMSSKSETAGNIVGCLNISVKYISSMLCILLWSTA